MSLYLKWISCRQHIVRSFFLFKSLLNLLQYCFCFMFWFFGHEACVILALQRGIEPIPPALEGEVLTTGQPGKSLVGSCSLIPSDNLYLLFGAMRPLMFKVIIDRSERIPYLLLFCTCCLCFLFLFLPSILFPLCGVFFF